MPDHARASDPLVRAIAELREQVDHLIDEQKVLLNRLEEESAGVELPQASTPDPGRNPRGSGCSGSVRAGPQARPR